MPTAAHRWLVAILVALLLAVVGMPHAAGHSFLARTQPAQGERLADPPRDVLLQFSEPVEPDRAQVSITDHRGGHLEAGRLTFEADNRVVRVPLVSPGGGVYRVSWHVISASDGHQSAGEFVFTVGDSTGLEAAGLLTGASTRPSPAATAATWLLLAGWSIAFAAAVLALATAGVAFPGRPEVTPRPPRWAGRSIPSTSRQPACGSAGCRSCCLHSWPRRDAGHPAMSRP